MDQPSCQNCESPATVRFAEVASGRKVVRVLCEACAAEHEIQHPLPDLPFSDLHRRTFVGRIRAQLGLPPSG